MGAVLIVLFLFWIAALGVLVAVNGRYWKRVKQSRILWSLLLVGSWLLPVDSWVARVVVVAVLVGFFVIAARPAIKARRADIAFRREAAREARGEASPSC